MTPGRELDALVAEKVMGLKLRGPHPAHPLEFPLKPGIVLVDLPAEDPKPYSTDIAAAWEVVEKMRQRDFLLRLETEHGDTTYAAFSSRADESVAADETSSTAPHAICLAALKAAGNQQDGPG